MNQTHDLSRFVIETPDFVRSMTRARHLMREAELALKPFGSKAPNPKQARKILRDAIKELRKASVQ
jgi:hypothetical protein